MQHHFFRKFSFLLSLLLGASLGHLIAMGQVLWGAWQRRHETELLGSILLNSPLLWIALVVLLCSVAAWVQIFRQEAQKVL